jgi:hypothetical protein
LEIAEVGSCAEADCGSCSKAGREVRGRSCENFNDRGDPLPPALPDRPSIPFTESTLRVRRNILSKLCRIPMGGVVRFIPLVSILLRSPIGKSASRLGFGFAAFVGGGLRPCEPFSSSVYVVAASALVEPSDSWETCLLRLAIPIGSSGASLRMGAVDEPVDTSEAGR